MVHYWLARLTFTTGVLWVSETVTISNCVLFVSENVTITDCVLLDSETYHTSICCCNFKACREYQLHVNVCMYVCMHDHQFEQLCK